MTVHIHGHDIMLGLQSAFDLSTLRTTPFLWMVVGIGNNNGTGAH